VGDSNKNKIKKKKMSRAKWKGLFIEKFLLKKKFFNRNQKKIWSRRSTIPSILIGQKVLVYNGKEFKKIFINREKIGYKFGDFSFTRKHTKKIMKVVKKKK
jgi:small subunit ribosomal protein S19